MTNDAERKEAIIDAVMKALIRYELRDPYQYIDLNQKLAILIDWVIDNRFKNNNVDEEDSILAGIIRATMDKEEGK